MINALPFSPAARRPSDTIPLRGDPNAIPLRGDPNTIPLNGRFPQLPERLATLDAPSALPPPPGVAATLPLAPPGRRPGLPITSPNADALPAPTAILDRFSDQRFPPMPESAPSPLTPYSSTFNLRAPAQMDAPDTGLRAAALRMQTGHATPGDYKRLATRMAVEAGASPVSGSGFGVSGLPSPVPAERSVLPLLPSQLQPGQTQREEARASGRFVFDQQANERAQQDKANADAAVFGKTRALEAMLKTHPEDLGLTPEQVKEYLALNPQENAHMRYARLSGIYQEASQRAEARRRQQGEDRQQQRDDRAANAGYGSAAEAQASIPAGSKGQVSQTSSGRWVVQYGVRDELAPYKPESTIGKLHADLAAALAAGDQDQAAALRAAIGNEINKGNRPMTFTEYQMAQMMDQSGQMKKTSYKQYRDDFAKQMREWQASPEGMAEAQGMAGSSASAFADAVARERTATNPNTGERMIFRNGQWQPLK